MKKGLVLVMIAMISAMMVPSALAAWGSQYPTPGGPIFIKLMAPLQFLWGYQPGLTPQVVKYGVHPFASDANVVGEDVAAGSSNHIYFKGSKWSELYKQTPMTYRPGDYKDFEVEANGAPSSRYTLSWYPEQLNPYMKYTLKCGSSSYNMKKMKTLHMLLDGNGNLNCHIQVRNQNYASYAWPSVVKII